MDLNFTREDAAFRDEVRAFIAEHVDESLSRETREVGNEGRGPRARKFLDALRDRGWWGLSWPKEYGGLEKTAVEQ